MGWVVAVGLLLLIFLIAILQKRKKEKSYNTLPETNEGCGDVINDVAASTQEGFWDRFIKDLDEQVKLLPEKKYYGTYRTTAVRIIPRNEKSHRYSIVPTNQKARRRPRQQTKRR